MAIFFVLGDHVAGEDIPIVLPGGDVSWTHPDPPPEYLNGLVAPDIRNEGDDIFELNRPGISLQRAITESIYGDNDFSGNVYFGREQAAPAGNFGWLQWRGSGGGAGGAVALANSLEPPGNFYSVTLGLGYEGSEVDLNDSRFENGLPPGFFTGDGYANPDPSLEPFGPGILEPGEFVWVQTGNIRVGPGVATWLQYYIDNQVPVVLLVFDKTNQQICDELGVACSVTGQNTLYRAYAFITVEIIGYKFQGGVPPSDPHYPKWIVFRFLNARNECGEVG